MKVLLIVDPQNDFITGSLAVPGAKKAMDYLTEWLREHHTEYDAFVVTLDQHPADHCSFQVQGGQWPIHCVRYTVGAALYPPLAEILMNTKRSGASVFFVPKAMSRHRDAYSAFEDAVPELRILMSQALLGTIASKHLSTTYAVIYLRQACLL